MKKFFHENWFKLGLLAMLLLFLLLSMYILLFKKEKTTNNADNITSLNKLSGVITDKVDQTLSPISKNESETESDIKISNSKNLSKNNVVITTTPAKITTQPVVSTKASEETILYNHDSFVAELSGVYKKVIADFSNSVNINIMTLVHKKDMGQALGYINSGYSVIVAQRDGVKKIEGKYGNLNYEDQKALYAMKKATDNYYLSLITEKKIYERNGSEAGIKDSDIDSIVETNSLASSYLDDVYEYLLLQR